MYIKDAIYGYLIFEDELIDLIDSYPLQRLKRIRQLSGSEYVYVTATHCRFSHSLGVSHLAEQMITNLLMKNEELENIVGSDSESIIFKIKTAALLHDIGHGSFSHIFETILNESGKNHEDMSEWLIRESEVAGLLEKIDLDSNEISQLAVGRLPGKTNRFLNQIISSGIDVDSFDYVVRDSQFSGAEYGSVDILRLIFSTDVDLKDFNLIVNRNALNTLEAFVIARYESFKSIYFHKTSRAVQIMLSNALQLVKDELHLTSFDTPEDYLKIDDYSMWTYLRDNEKTRHIIDAISRRKLLKVVFEKTSRGKDQKITSLLSDPKVKEQVQGEIAEISGIGMDELFIDMPNLPSVPYHTSSEMDPLEVPIFDVKKDGTKVLKSVSDVSSVIRALKGFTNIIRIYTTDEHREKVREAALKVLGEDTI